MATHDKYFTGSTVSRNLPSGERSFSQVIYQSGKPVLDAELNLDQDVKQEIQKLLGHQQLPSGFFRPQTRKDNEAKDYSFVSDTNVFKLSKITALVAGFPVIVEYTDTDTAGENKILLEAPTNYDGQSGTIKRTDFVFLEVWQSLVSPTPAASGTVQVVTAADISNGDTVDVGDPLHTGITESYTAVNTLSNPNDFLIGTGGTAQENAIQTAANLTAIINSQSSLVYAHSFNTDTTTIISKLAGVIGNDYTITVTNANVGAMTPPTQNLLGGGPNATNKPSQDKLYRHGNTLSSSTVAVDDDLRDPIINSESTKRVQIQYRIRKTGSAEGVSPKTQNDGFSNTNVEAQGGVAAPVTGYQFVKADGTSILNNSSAVAYDIIDNGLWIAGDGSQASATALGTVDGFVYAIPICFVFRRNATPSNQFTFDPQNNANGGLLSTHSTNINNANVGMVPAGKSDRPDGLFPDIIVRDDVLDLRRHISPNGVDLASELHYQMKSLLDGNYRTWGIDMSDMQTFGNGSGCYSVRPLVCDEIGRDQAQGGQGAVSGDTKRGVVIRNFDHIARRFGDQPVVERMVFAFLPNMIDDPNLGGNPGRFVVQKVNAATNWTEGDELHLDLSSLNSTTLGSWLLTNQTASKLFTDLAPPETTITDILISTHDDGHYSAAKDQTVQIKQTEGLGTDYVIITLDRNDREVNGGDPTNSDYKLVRDINSPDVGTARRIFIEFEITYPLGYGLTNTPDEEVTPDPAVYPYGALLENDIPYRSNPNINSQEPLDKESLLKPAFRQGFREVMLEYQANKEITSIGSGIPIEDDFVSIDDRTLRGFRRLYGDTTNTVVIDKTGPTLMTIDHTQTEYGSSSRKVVLDASQGTLSGAQTLCTVKYFAQDPIPNYGAEGYQISVYYRTNAPQTCGSKTGDITNNGLPSTLTVTPLLMSHELWSGNIGMGSVELPFPYVAPLDQIPVNDVGHPSQIKEWFFMATAHISIDDFDANTGLLNLHTFVPADGTGDLNFEIGAAPSSQMDAEFRAYYHLSDPTAYRPTAFTQNLSGVVRHKCFMPFLAKATQDTTLFRKGEVLLLVISRWAELDAKNNVVFKDLPVDQQHRTCVAVYRTKNLLILSGD